MKNKNESKDVIVIDERYIGITLLGVAALWSVLIIFVSIFPSDVTGKTKIIVASTVIFVNMLIYVLGLHYYFYELRVASNGIYYRKGIWGIHWYSIEHVQTFEVNDNKLIIRFVDNNKVVVGLTERSYAIINKFTKMGIQENKRDVRNTDGGNAYVIKATKFYIGFSLICVLLCVALMILFVATRSLSGLVMFALVMFGCVLDFAKKVWDKIIVDDKDITIYRVFKKVRSIKASDIKSIKRKMIDNAEVIYIYGEKDLLFKYSKLNTNALRFESVIAKKPIKGSKK